MQPSPKPQIRTSFVLGDVSPDGTYFILQNGKKKHWEVYFNFICLTEMPCSLERVCESRKQRHLPLPYDSLKNTKIVTEHSTVMQPL